MFVTRSISSHARRVWLGATLALAAIVAAPTAWAQTTTRSVATAAPAPAVAAASIASGAGADYRLGIGDVVRVTVFQNPDLGVEVRISESGAIVFPLIGTVQVSGLTSSQAEQRIADALRTGNFVKQPQVSLLVSQIRSNLVSVLGLVNRPGRYPLETSQVRLTDMLATAGGVAPGGADVITVVGTRNGQPFRSEIDLGRSFASKTPPQELFIQNGDVVYVDRSPTIYIYGEVQRPGVLRLERDMTVLQALASGGGLTQRGTERGMRLHRRGPDGKMAITQPSMDDPLRDGDVIYVRESLF